MAAHLAAVLLALLTLGGTALSLRLLPNPLVRVGTYSCAPYNTNPIVSPIYVPGAASTTCQALIVGPWQIH